MRINSQSLLHKKVGLMLASREEGLLVQPLGSDHPVKSLDMPEPGLPRPHRGLQCIWSSLCPSSCHQLMVPLTVPPPPPSKPSLSYDSFPRLPSLLLVWIIIKKVAIRTHQLPRSIKMNSQNKERDSWTFFSDSSVLASRSAKEKAFIGTWRSEWFQTLLKVVGHGNYCTLSVFLLTPWPCLYSPVVNVQKKSPISTLFII